MLGTVVSPSKPDQRSLLGAKSTLENLIGTKVDSARLNALVFAVTGYVGAGATLVVTALAEKLQAAGYTPKTIKMSGLIEQDPEILLSRPADHSGSERAILVDELKRRWPSFDVVVHS